MALNIEFEGYVNEIKQFDWGTVVSVSHAQRAKNQGTGEWETVGKDYIDVTVPQGLSVPAQNSVATIVGTLKVGTYVKKDGSTGVSLKVRAKDIRNSARKPAAAEPEIW
jgi:hypothetical protein